MINEAKANILGTEPDDAVLCRSSQKGDGIAVEILVKRYSRLVKTCARPYFLMGADAEDLLQEGMLGLMQAIRDFDESKGAPFSAYARLCVTRKVYSAVRSASAHKHEPLNHSVSFDRSLFEDLARPNSSAAAPASDPESLVIGIEERKEMVNRLYKLLSGLEAKVLSLYLEGYSYDEMSRKLGKPVKSVDNAIQRIKRKSAEIN